MRGDLLKSVNEKLRNIFAAVAQRGNDYSQGTEAVCQVRGEAVGADEGSKAALCESDDTWSLRSVFAQQAKQGCLGTVSQPFRTREIEHAHRGRGIFGLAVGEERVRLG